jgi:hypothetical protein
MTTKDTVTRIGLPVLAVLASIGIGFAGITSAQSSTTAVSESGMKMERGIGMMGMRGERPAVVGKVTSVSGTTLTVQSQRPGDTSTMDYTVDASSAKILKGTEGAAPTESTLSAVAVGDTVAVRGTLSGTSVTATEIIDGPMMKHGFGGHGGRGHGTRGTVAAINGNTITLTGENGTTYTVDASGAQIGKVTTITVGDVQVGDTLNVMGEVSGTNVTAKHIMDGVPPRPQQ